MTKWKAIIGGVLIVVFIVIGTVLNYVVFKDNADKQQEIHSNETAYSSDPEKPVAGKAREEREPVLELTQDHVDLETGAIFNAIDYIKKAEDLYGVSIKEKVIVDQAIPTDQPGEYEVEYILELTDGNKLIKKLSITVKDMLGE